MTDKKEKEHQEMDPKVGVYVCHCGGNISDHVNVEKVCERAGKLPGVVVSRGNMFMCSDPGQELIMKDIESGNVDRIVVASCAPSLHEQTFRSAISRAGGNPYVYEHANIREQVSWVHHGDGATDKATTLVAAATAKAKQLKALEPIRMEARRHATVIGGGVAGLKAAKDLARRGIDVALIEKSPFLGGWTAQLERLSPTGESASDLIETLVHEVLNDPKISVYHCAQVVSFDGYIGNFKLRVKTQPPGMDGTNQDVDRIDGLSKFGKGFGTFIPLTGVCPGPIPESTQEIDLETGVIVVATGFKPYEPRQSEYGYRDWDGVVTLPQFLRMMAENGNVAPDQEAESMPGKKPMLRFNGRDIRSIAMIHCVGSRMIPGIHEETEEGHLNEYCSRTCCSSLLHTATRIREEFPGTRVFDFYRDIRTYGRGQEEIYEQAARNQVLFLRFDPEEPPAVIKNTDSGKSGNSSSRFLVKVKDTLTFGEEVEVPADLVVLAVGMEPNNVSELVEMMKLPVGADRFLLEVHPKLRPVELSVNGIFLAGTCQAPFDVGEACAAASSAAAKASAVLAPGFVELDPFVAEVDLEKCTGTGACVEACLQDGALSLVETQVDGQAVQRGQVNPALCTGCGTCVAVCPEGAINVKGWTLGQFESMVDMIVSDEYLS
jgi:heterodisulfide reductase subunit A